MQGYALAEAGTGRFAREGSAGGAHVASLDGWRGLSLLLVFIGHFTAYYEAAALGVELFFVLSGRLMADILILRREPIGTFFWRRASRILPVPWPYIAVVFLGPAASALYQARRRDNPAGPLPAWSLPGDSGQPRPPTPLPPRPWPPASPANRPPRPGRVRCDMAVRAIRRGEGSGRKDSGGGRADHIEPEPVEWTTK